MTQKTRLQIIEPGVLLHGGDDTQRYGGTEGQEDRHDRQFHGDQKAVLQLGPDRGLVPQGRAQVSTEHTPQPARVLDVNGPVKAQPLPQLLELFWRDRTAVAFSTPQDRQSRVSGDNPEQGEHHDRR